MKHKPWEMTEGGLVCCGLIVVGLLLQLFSGPVNWDLMAWPVNFLVLLIMLSGIVVMHLSRNRFHLFRWMSTLQAGIPAMVSCALLTILMGVTRQVPSGHVPMEPIGITAMLSFWPFVLSYAWLVLLVGMVCMTRLCHPSWRNIPFLLNHLGLFLALVAGTLGNADMQRLFMTIQEGRTEWRAIDSRHRVHQLPIAIELHDFSIRETPKLSYLSDVTVYTKSGTTLRDTILVNKPLSVRGWKIYQYSYDETKGSMSDISIFEVVRDPWLPYVYCGIFMMLLGALSMFIKTPTAFRNGERDGGSVEPSQVSAQAEAVEAVNNNI